MRLFFYHAYICPPKKPRRIVETLAVDNFAAQSVINSPTVQLHREAKLRLSRVKPYSPLHT